MIDEILSEIGLTQGERNVYLSLLELGSTSIGKIIEESGVSGSKTYEVLDRLTKKGLVSFIMKGKVKYFEASPPESILDYLKEKENTLEKTRKKALQIIPELKVKQSMAKEQGSATVFIGSKGMKNAYIQSAKDLKKGDTIYGMFIPPVKKSLLGFFVNWQKEFARKYGGVNKLIFNEPCPQIAYSKKIPRFKVKMAPKEIKSPTEISIVANNVIISTTGGDESFTVLIKNREVTKSFIEYFETIWEISKEI